MCRTSDFSRCSPGYASQVRRGSNQILHCGWVIANGSAIFPFLIYLKTNKRNLGKAMARKGETSLRTVWLDISNPQAADSERDLRTKT